MATERLIVKNFGPIQEADLDLRKVTVLIGEQASGKSVLAKLLSILRDPKILQKQIPETETQIIKITDFENRLRFYEIDEFLVNDSMITYKCDEYQFVVSKKEARLEFRNSGLKHIIQSMLEARKADKTLERKGIKAFRDKDFEKTAKVSAERKVTHSKLIELEDQLSRITFETEYVPAERSTVNTSVSWYFDDNYITEFHEEFNGKSRLKKRFSIRPLDIDYVYDLKSKEGLILIKDGQKHRIAIASNGIQSVVPIFVFVETSNPILNYLFIIEEPELNLYPTTQKKLVEYLVEKCTKGDNRLIITTHSPYILTALNNCIEAANVLKSHPEAKEKVDKLVPPESQIAYEDVAAYYVANGTVRSIMNEEYQIIDANALDDVSEELSRVHGDLLDLKYQHQD